MYLTAALFGLSPKEQATEERSEAAVIWSEMKDSLSAVQENVVLSYALVDFFLEWRLDRSSPQSSVIYIYIYNISRVGLFLCLFWADNDDFEHLSRLSHE